MAVSLSKGGNVNLSKEAPGLTKIMVGLGWDARSTDGTDFAFLEELDELPGRYVDNANFFSVEDPEHVPDDELYELLMAEYPTWLHEAARLGLLR